MDSGTPKPDLFTALYAHAKCPEWGLGVLAWERGPRRAYQFEDGKLRTFHEGYYDMIQEVDAPADRVRAVAAALQRKLGHAADLAARTSSTSDPLMSFDDQVKVFSMLFPEGFADPAWLSKKRGAAAGRRLKSHRDPAIAEARTRLADDAIVAAIHGRRPGDVVEAARVVLRGTNLVTAKQLAILDQLAPGRHARFADALHELLWGEDPYALRFERWVATLSLGGRRTPSWELATALTALVHPDVHVAVRVASFRRQAAWMAPRIRITTTPNATMYQRLLDMIGTVRDELATAGHEPRDLMDVLDFILETMKPSATKLLEH